jgi:hypothetical protein
VKSSPTAKRKLLARITIAYAALWFVILLAIRVSAPLLIDTALPFWMRRGLIEIADVLLVLSIVLVPLAVWIHARLCHRYIRALAAHISVGPATTLLALLIAHLPLRGIQVVPQRFPSPPLAPAAFILMVAGVIAVIASIAVWYFAVRHVPSRDAEILSRFD